MKSRKAYQSTRVGSVDAEEGHRGLVGGAGGRCSGGSVASGRSEAGSNWGAGSTCPESSAEGTGCGHGGQRGDGLRDGGACGAQVEAVEDVAIEVSPRLGTGRALSWNGI